MEESTVVNEWIAKGEKRGEARGIAIGEARGIIVGKIRQTQQLIMTIGTQRFGIPPERIEAIVQAIQDHARLERIIDRITEAASWEDLLATA